MKIALAKLKQRGLESLIPLGTIKGDNLEVSVRDYVRHAQRLPRAEPIQPPTVAEMASNFMAATARWVAAGFPLVSQPEYEARAAVCDACQYWDGTARAGLGKCNSPGCGCTGMKRWLSTEKCPQGKWPRLTP